MERYIHIPLGGGFLTTVLVFSFVALWHDLSFKLLAWGWLVSLFILPELGARAMLPAKKVRLPVRPAVSFETEGGSSLGRGGGLDMCARRARWGTC